MSYIILLYDRNTADKIMHILIEQKHKTHT